jgi:Glycosyltransferase
VNEAMACGIPVIVSNKVGCASDLVKNEIDGFIFSSNNKSKLMEHICKFFHLTSKELQKMRTNSLSIIGEYNIDINIKVLLNTIESVR